jgi:hypothetical protein
MIVLVQMPIARASFFLSNFLIHLHNLVAIILFACILSKRIDLGIGLL